MIKEEFLIKIGLSPKKAKVYLALLENGPLIIQKISDKAKVKRTTLYPILKKMTDDDLIGIEVRQKRKYYFVKSPEKLLFQLREQKNFLEALMPQLQTLFEKQTAGSRIQVYDTAEKLRKTLEEINLLDPEKDEILTIEGDIKQALKLGFDFWKELLATKKKLGIVSRTVLPSYCQDYFVIRDHQIKIRTSKFLNNFKIMLYLFSNKTLIIVPSQPLCIVIENKKIKDSLADIFEIIWRRAKPIN